MAENADGYTLIKAKSLIDGRGGPPIQDGAVLVHGSRIRQVGTARDVVPPGGCPA